MTRPRARQDVLLTELADECLIYDFGNHQAHCLDRGAGAVWRHCDGARSVAQLVAAVGDELGKPVDAAWVQAALDQLDEAALLERPRGVDVARRRFVTRAALTAGVAVALPAVWSIVAPTVAQAASKVTCVPPSACMGGAGSGTCCGTSGTTAAACDGNGNCSGMSITCTGLCR